MAGLHDMILLSGRVFCNISHLWKVVLMVALNLPVFPSLHASYLILIRYFSSKGWYIVLTSNNSSWIFSELSTRGRRRTTWSDGYMVYQWVTQGIRRDRSKTRRGLDNEESECLRKKNLRRRLCYLLLADSYFILKNLLKFTKSCINEIYLQEIIKSRNVCY